MRYALASQKKYPINTLSEIKTAERYFLEYEREIPLEFRREFCKNLIDRQKELNLVPNEKIATYASDIVDQDKVKLAVELRKLYLADEDKKKALDKIAEESKTADSIIAAFIKFDRSSLLDTLWDNQVPNPIIGTVTLPKKPVPNIIQIGADYATVDQIKQLANRRDKLSNVLSDSYIPLFMEDPLGVFEELSTPEKKMILQLAKSETI